MSSITSGAATAAGKCLTSSELEQGRIFLEESRAAVFGAIQRLSEAQWRFKPAADRWSIAEIVDHVVFVQERVLGMVLEQIPLAPATPPDYDTKAVYAIAINQFVNRIQRFPAPEFLVPAGRFSPVEAASELSNSHKRLLDGLETAPALRGHVLESPPLKAVTHGAYTLMDGYQWILAAAAHTQRHTKQILEVIADKGFPA